MRLRLFDLGGIQEQEELREQNITVANTSIAQNSSIYREERIDKVSKLNIVEDNNKYFSPTVAKKMTQMNT